MLMQKSLIQRLEEGRNGFGSVSELGAGLPLIEDMGGLVLSTAAPQTSTDAVPQNDLLTSLLRLQAESPDDPQLARLVTKLTPLLIEAEQVQEQRASEARAAFDARLKEIRAEGRKQALKCQRMNNNLGGLEVLLDNTIAQREAAERDLTDLRVAERKGKHLSQWHTDEEKERWDKRVAAAVKRFNELNDAEMEVRSAVVSARDELRREEKKLQELSHEMTVVRKRIEGKPYRDPTTGLMTT